MPERKESVSRDWGCVCFGASTGVGLGLIFGEPVGFALWILFFVLGTALLLWSFKE